MSQGRVSVAAGIRFAASIALILVIFLLVSGNLAGVSLLVPIVAALQRVAAAVFADTAELRWLIVIALAFGALALAGHRRRSRVRQASC